MRPDIFTLNVVFIFAGRLGKTAIATHSGIFQIFWLLTSIMWAVMTATRVRVSQYLGAGNTDGAKLAGKVGLCVGALSAVVVAVAMILGRDEIGILLE